MADPVDETIETFPGLVIPATGARFTDASGRRFSPALALALWHLVRHLDTAGQGRVPLAVVREAGRRLWSKHTYCRALREAEFLELVEVVERQRDAEPLVVYRSTLRVAERLNVTSLGARKVGIPLASLRSAKDFKTALWAAYHAGRSHRTKNPISRATLTALTGVSRRTQRRYEVRSGQVRAQRNTIIVGYGPDALRTAREFLNGGCYIPGRQPYGPVHAPLPNTYSATLPLGSRRAASKINRTLAGGLPMTPSGQHKRVFFETAAAAEKAMRQGKAADVTMTRDGPGQWRLVVDQWAQRFVYGVV